MLVVFVADKKLVFCSEKAAAATLLFCSSSVKAIRMPKMVIDSFLTSFIIMLSTTPYKSIFSLLTELLNGIKNNRFYIRWISVKGHARQQIFHGESAFPCPGNALFNSTYEIKKLQKQNEELRMENELLKNSRPS
jgi:hypothetical protein